MELETIELYILFGPPVIALITFLAMWIVAPALAITVTLIMNIFDNKSKSSVLKEVSE